MKKRLIVLFVIASLFVLAGCDPGVNSLDKRTLLENTVKIELMEYENPAPKLVQPGKKDPSRFHFDNATSIATLDASRFEALITEIAQTELLLWGRTLNEPIGKTLVLYQKDGSMLVLFSTIYENKTGSKRYYACCNLYDENGTFVEYLGDLPTDYVATLEDRHFQTEH